MQAHGPASPLHLSLCAHGLQRRQNLALIELEEPVVVGSDLVNRYGRVPCLFVLFDHLYVVGWLGGAYDILSYHLLGHKFASLLEVRWGGQYCGELSLEARVSPPFVSDGLSLRTTRSNADMELSVLGFTFPAGLIEGLQKFGLWREPPEPVSNLAS